MLSIFSSIKNRLFSKRKKPKNHKYNIVFEDEIMPVDLTSDGDDVNNDAPPPPSPVVTRRLFNIELDNDIIKKDYELQKLVNTIDLYQFNVENVILERRIEQLINNIPNADDILKIKIKILYVVIAHDLYRNLFEEKKRYHSTKTKQYIGVFRYNDYIIRIDDSPYSFINEADVVGASVDNIDSNIIQPFLIYTNIRRNSVGEICDCLTTNRCDCKYTDDVTEQPSSSDGDSDGDGGDDYDVRLVSYNNLRENAISFSIQYYVKNTVSLYNWVNDNIGNCAYNKFSSIQHPFFIHLFYQCARLLRKIHKVSVVHGDIKPDNILIREHDNFNINHPEKCKHFTVFLIDFGLSGIHDVGVGTGGTIPYCHPEFKNIVDTNRSSKYNWKIMNKKHDVWSLGVAFITMYIYRDFYNYYHKYPSYFFTKDGYVSSLIIDVVTHDKLNSVFTKLLSIECISSEELCEILGHMSGG